MKAKTLTKDFFDNVKLEKDFKRIKKGVFETFYGNAAFVSSNHAKQAFDIDMGMFVPIEEIDFNKFIRKER